MSPFLKDQIEYESIAFANQYGTTGDEDWKRAGVFVGHELHFNKNSFVTQFGYYAYYDYDFEGRVYFRGGLKRRFTKNIFGAITLKSHGAKAEAVENLSKGEAFLAENAQKEGVVLTESGLQYKVVNQGDGPIPTIKDKVTVHYRGTLIDGEEFDSSYKRGQPTSFPVTGVIKGWTEALQLMPVGSKWELFIPSNLAYGNSPRSPGGPNSSLVFEVELIGIE